MIKQNHTPTKKKRLLRSALGKFAPIFNHLKKIEADLRGAGLPGAADQAIRIFQEAQAFERDLLATEREEETA